MNGYIRKFPLDLSGVVESITIIGGVGMLQQINMTIFGIHLPMAREHFSWGQKVQDHCFNSLHLCGQAEGTNRRTDILTFSSRHITFWIQICKEQAVD